MARTLTGTVLWQELGWQPSPGQEQLLLDLQDQLRQWNGRVNLTRLVEDDDFWIAQVFDSLWPLAPLLQSAAAQEPLRLIDVGTGGGFPGLALAIAFPQAQLTLVDSVGRKVDAVRAMAEALGLGERVSLRCRTHRPAAGVPGPVRLGPGAGRGQRTRGGGIPGAPAATPGPGPALPRPVVGLRPTGSRRRPGPPEGRNRALPGPGAARRPGCPPRPGGAAPGPLSPHLPPGRRGAGQAAPRSPCPTEGRQEVIRRLTG